MKKCIKSILPTFLYVLLIAEYGVGVIHSFKKHGVADGFIGVVIFPWAMYRGVEMFWHDDYADVDWNKQLENDMRTCVYFFTEALNSESNQYQVKEDLTKFSSKVFDYPKNKKQFLVNGSRKYILYNLSLMEDMMNSVNNFSNTKKLIFSFSDKSRRLESDLNSFGLHDDIELIKKGFEIFNKEMEEKFQDDSTAINFEKFKSDYESSYLLLVEYQTNRLKITFKALFNEEF